MFRDGSPTPVSISKAAEWIFMDSQILSRTRSGRHAAPPYLTFCLMDRFWWNLQGLENKYGKKKFWNFFCHIGPPSACTRRNFCHGGPKMAQNLRKKIWKIAIKQQMRLKNNICCYFRLENHRNFWSPKFLGWQKFLRPWGHFWNFGVRFRKFCKISSDLKMPKNSRIRWVGSIIPVCWGPIQGMLG